VLPSTVSRVYNHLVRSLTYTYVRRGSKWRATLGIRAAETITPRNLMIQDFETPDATEAWLLMHAKKLGVPQLPAHLLYTTVPLPLGGALLDDLN